MAPGPKLSSDSPMGEDIKRVVREMLEEELKLKVDNRHDQKTITLMLGEKELDYVCITVEDEDGRNITYNLEIV